MQSEPCPFQMLHVLVCVVSQRQVRSSRQMLISPLWPRTRDVTA